MNRLGAAHRPALGLALLLTAALFFSLHNTLARLSYDHGVAPTTITATRTWAILLIFAVTFGRMGVWPRVPRPAWPVFAVTAVCYGLHNPLLLVAFQFVPVSVAVLVIYLCPIAVAFIAAAVGLEKLRVRILAAAAVAFAGVGLVLQVGGNALDWRGLALAGVAALTLAGNVVGAAQLNRHMSALGVPYALSCVGALVFGALMVADGGPTLPASMAGWGIFVAAALTSPAALIAFYAALPLAGASRSAITMSSEPLITVLLAALLLGEMLNFPQGVGAILIVSAVVVAAPARLGARPR
jgi:drug/metabolite transporter (DMT)-like permease